MENELAQSESFQENNPKELPRPKSVGVLAIMKSANESNLRKKLNEIKHQNKQELLSKVVNIKATRKKKAKDHNEEEEHQQNESKRYKSAENFYKIKDRDKQRDKEASTTFNISDKTLIYELRNTFQKSLAKLNTNDTKEVAYKELVNIISRFTNAQSLRVFISLLSISPKNCPLSAKESQVMLVGVLAQVFQENLLDPLDKPPNIIKSIDRLIRVVHSFMKENSEIVHLACCESIIQLYKNCMPKDDPTLIMKLFFDYPVKFIEGGINLVIQKASALCLSSMISFLKNEEESQLLDYVTPSVLALFLKTNFDSPYLFDSVLYLVEYVNFSYFTEKLKEIYEKLIKVLENPKTLDNSRLSCCRIFKALGDKLMEAKNNQPLGFYICDVLQALRNATKDRIHKIQVAGREALRIWLDLEKISNELEAKKTNLVVGKEDNEKYEDFKSRILKSVTQGGGDVSTMLNYSNHNKLSLLRNLSKMNKDFSNSNTNILTGNNKEKKEDDGFITNKGHSLISRFAKNAINNSSSLGKGNEFKELNTENYLKYGKIPAKDKIIPSESLRKRLDPISNEDYDNNNKQSQYNSGFRIEEEEMEDGTQAMPEARSGNITHKKQSNKKHEINSEDNNRINNNKNDKDAHFAKDKEHRINTEKNNNAKSSKSNKEVSFKKEKESQNNNENALNDDSLEQSIKEGEDNEDVEYKKSQTDKNSHLSSKKLEARSQNNNTHNSNSNNAIKETERLKDNKDIQADTKRGSKKENNSTHSSKFYQRRKSNKEENALAKERSYSRSRSKDTKNIDLEMDKSKDNANESYVKKQIEQSIIARVKSDINKQVKLQN